MMENGRELMSADLERALRWAAACHAGQVRKVDGAPYVQHVVAVAMILDRLGFGDDVVIAGLLHDVVEDTDATLEQVREQFGDEVARTVEACSEIKTDASGQKRPWIDRKRDHIEALASATVPARAVMLADKLHNLLSIACDLRDGRPVWSLFNAARPDVLWYYRTVVDRSGAGDPRLEALARDCGRLLAEIEAHESENPDGGLVAENRQTSRPDG